MDLSFLLFFEVLMLLVLFQLLTEALHEGLLFCLFGLWDFLLRRDYQLLRACFLFFAVWFGLGIEVTVYELKDEILVVVEGFDVAV